MLTGLQKKTGKWWDSYGRRRQIKKRKKYVSGDRIALWSAKNRCHELIIRNLNPTIAIRVHTPEILRKLLYDYTRANESIKSNASRLRTISGSWSNGSVFMFYEAK